MRMTLNSGTRSKTGIKKIRRNIDGETVVWIAARYGHTEMVRCLVQDYHMPVDTANALGVTPLIAAADHGHTNTVRCLVQDCGADVNAADDDSETPLLAAARSGHTETVRCLVQDCRADVNAADYESETKYSETPLLAAVRAEHTETVQCLVQECEADVNASLSHAARYGDTETARLLLQECGANVNYVKPGSCESAIMYAAWGGHTETVRMLVDEFGADVAADARGRTPVYVAARNGHIETVRMLVRECGVNVNTATTDGNTPLIVAARQGHTEMVRVLVWEFHAALDVQNNTGKTAVLDALCKGKVETARVLVQECGANAMIADNNGVTPITVAAQYEDGGVLWMLTRTCRVPVSERRRQLACAMGLHTRLGNGSIVSRLNPELLDRILKHLPALASESTHLAATNEGRMNMEKNLPLLRWMEAAEDRPPKYAEANETRRINLERRPCPVCLQVLGGNAKALAPCGHRICSRCWETYRETDTNTCPFRCPEKIKWGGDGREFPDEYKLYSRFCVEVPHSGIYDIKK